MNLDHLLPLAEQFFATLDSDKFLIEHASLLAQRSKRVQELLQEDRIPSLSSDELRALFSDTDSLSGNWAKPNEFCNTIFGKENEHVDSVRAWLIDLVRVGTAGITPQEFNRLRSGMRGVGPSFISEILMYCFPDRYWFWNGPIKKFIAQTLGEEVVKDAIPFGKKSDLGEVYVEARNVIGKIREFLAERTNRDVDFITVDLFMYWANQLPAFSSPMIGEVETAYDGPVQNLVSDSEQMGSDSPALKPRIWLIAAGPGGSLWQNFLDDDSMLISYEGIGDLRNYTSHQHIQHALSQLFHGGEKQPFHDSLACYQFLHDVAIGDIVVAKAGIGTILGYGVVNGPYEYIGEDSSSPYGHRRSVHWKKVGNWPITREKKLVTKTLTDITDNKSLIAHIEELLGEKLTSPASVGKAPVVTAEAVATKLFVETNTIERWRNALNRKGQIVFYGPPGTGKTFTAREFARHLIGGGRGFTEVIQFHPSYSYEEFMMGIRPSTNGDGTLAYRMTPGVFMNFCEKASTLGKDDICVLILDEINRANLSRVFGELMYLLEYREESVRLAGDGREFHIPENVRIIGTMNTADRSIALVDHALRRRFAFIELRPEYDVLRMWHERNGNGFNADGLVQTLKDLNASIKDAHYEVGISFFLRGDLASEIEHIWRMEIEPYLHEFFFDRPAMSQRFSWEKVREHIAQ